MSTTLSGPQAWRRWREHLAGEPVASWAEIELFSDAHFTGQIVAPDCGPFEVLNGIADGPATNVRPVAVLRVHDRARRSSESLVGSTTDSSTYHGGSEAAEIAALVSLRLGCRLYDGPVSRVGEPGKPDRPMRLEWGSVPMFSRAARLVLPAQAETKHVVADVLNWYPGLGAADAVAVARCARQYQQAVWNAESDGNLAWLQLVSAVEIAAVRWRENAHEDDEALLRALRPKWSARLEKAGGAELVRDMAAEWGHLLSATKRFIDFVLAHLPAPPVARTPFAQVDWSPKQIKESLSMVYDLRSSALHGGNPFPLPMCLPPIMFEGVAVERPAGVAASAGGATWLAEDMPMHLHIFEYLARSAILKWIDSLLPQATT